MTTAIEAQDLLPVRSRVSWGAILAGSVVALAVYLLLSSLGLAVHLTVDENVTERALGIGTGIWAVVSLLVSLFLGGWITSQCTAGENRAEAVVYGVVVWGLFFAALFWLVSGGVRMGFNAIAGIASSPATSAVVNRMSDEDLRAAGFTPEQISNMRGQFDQLRERLQTVKHDPRTTAAAWWTFAGLCLSVVAAVAGAVAGAGPNLVLMSLHTRSTTVGMTYPTTRPGEAIRSTEDVNR
ncbi:MAG TPA: hypothetical protein VNK04_17290 [Gemmataceae bacterium]|nr:hypothetical protein [Gemmataceae bacterium]